MKNFNLIDMVSQNNQVKYIPTDMLVPYHNHQFRLYSGERFDDMVESIRQNGILNPIIVQPIENASKYEILSGHNRVEGAKTVGLNSVPAIVKENLFEEEAEMYVIETNLIQRGFNELSISEQANVLGYRYSKMFSQGKRNDIIEEINRLEGKSSTCGQSVHKLKSRDALAKEYFLNSRTVARLLRVNQLIPPFKSMVDEKKLPYTVAIELSYIPQDGQELVYEVFNTHGTKVSMKLSKDVRNLFATSDNVTKEAIESLLTPKDQPKAMKKVSISKEVYEKYFDSKATSEDIAETIHKALDMYFNIT